VYPSFEGNAARNFTTLISMITGMIQSRHCQLPALAGKCSIKTKRESQTKKFTRWLQNNKINANIYFLPFIKKIISILARDTIFLVFDGSTVAKDSACLMASIIYKKRAIPFAWTILEGRKGHFSEDVHLQLLEQVKSMLPDNSNVVILGDGEFDGSEVVQ